MVQPNYGFRAISDNADERRAVDEAFATLGAVGLHRRGRDRTAACWSTPRRSSLRDAHDVGADAEAGGLQRSTRRAARVNLERTKAFPRNTEIDVILTFTSSGDQRRQTGGGLPGGRVPTSRRRAQAITVQQHHSFVRAAGARLRAARLRSARRRFFGSRTATSRRRSPSR